MTAYWLLFFIPLIGHFWGTNATARSSSILWAAMVIVLIVFVGLRYDIGCDWQDYSELYQAIKTNNPSIGSKFHFVNFESLTSYFQWGPTYLSLNKISVYFDLGLPFVNLICAVLMIYGLSKFFHELAYPWLAWLFATPYLIIVVGMGYTRQSVAIGLSYWALSYLERKKFRNFLLLIVSGATFHISALMLLPLALIPHGHKLDRQVIGRLSLTIFASILIGSYFIDDIVRYATTPSYSSAGGPIRATMTAIPATLLLLNYKRWAYRSDIALVWSALALASIAFFVLAWFWSTLIDRLGLLLIPFQIFCWTTLLAIVNNDRDRNIYSVALILYFGLVLIVWLNFAHNSYCWTHYQNVLFSLPLLNY